MISEEKLKGLMGTVLGVPEEQINETTSTDNLDQWDSLSHMNLILALEEEFDVEIPDEEVGNLTSYKLVKLVLDDLT